MAIASPMYFRKFWVFLNSESMSKISEKLLLPTSQLLIFPQLRQFLRDLLAKLLYQKIAQTLPHHWVRNIPAGRRWCSYRALLNESAAVLCISSNKQNIKTAANIWMEIWSHFRSNFTIEVVSKTQFRYHKLRTSDPKETCSWEGQEAKCSHDTRRWHFVCC